MSNRIVGYTVVTKTFRELARKKPAPATQPESTENEPANIPESSEGPEPMTTSRIKKAPKGHNGTTICHCNRRKASESSGLSENHLISAAEARFVDSLRDLALQFREPFPGEFTFDLLDEEDSEEEDNEGVEESDG